MSNLLRRLGPGFVFALTVIGPGDFVSNAVTGASQGYALLWALAIAVFFRFVWLDTSARYVLATGETLMDGYARSGPWLLWIIMGALVVIRFLANLYKLVLLGNTAELLLPGVVPGSRYFWGAAVAILAFLICDRGGYPALERGFKALVAIMCGALLVAAFLAKPSPSAILSGLFIPSFPDDRGAYGTLFLLMALIGTEAGSLTNVTYSYFVWRKGWRDPSFRGPQRTDLIMSVVCLFAMGTMVQVTAAGTLLPAGMIPTGSEDLVHLFTNTLGMAGKVIFTFGLCAAAFSSYIGGTMGYAMIATDIWPRLRSSAGSGNEESRRRHRGFLAFWCFAPLCLLFATDKPVWLVLFVSAIMAALIPVLASVLLIRASDRQRLGVLAPPLLLRASLALLVVVSSALLIMNATRWINDRLALL